MYTTGGSPWVFTCLSLALYLRQCTDIADAFLLFMSLLIIVTIFIVAMLAYVNVIMAVCRQRRYIFDSSVLKKRSLQLNGRALCPLKDNMNATLDCDDCIVQFEPVSRDTRAFYPSRPGRP